MRLDKATHQTNPQTRFGAAVVELAIMLPVLLLVGLGVIEICNMITLQQMSFRVAFDTARVVTQDDLTNSEAIAFANRKMSEVALVGDVSITVAESAVPEFEQVTINVTTRPFHRFSIAGLTRNMFANGVATAVRRTDPGPRRPSPTATKRGKGKRRDVDT